MTKAEEKSKDHLTRDYDKYRDLALEMRLGARRRLTRFLIGGNAGGAIATLGLIGTILGSGGGAPFPRELLWILIIFIVGLVCMWGGTAITYHNNHELWLHTMREHKRLRAGLSAAEQGPLSLVERSWVIGFVILRWVAIICLTTGCGLALFQLYLFSA